MATLMSRVLDVYCFSLGPSSHEDMHVQVSQPQTVVANVAISASGHRTRCRGALSTSVLNLIDVGSPSCIYPTITLIEQAPAVRPSRAQSTHSSDSMSLSTLRPLARVATRSLHTSIPPRAAAAPAAAVKPWVRKVPVKAVVAAPVSTSSAAGAPGPSVPSTPPSFGQDPFDDMPPLSPPPPEMSDVADYAKLKTARSSQPNMANPIPEMPVASNYNASTPQGAFPNDYYRPPVSGSSGGIPGEAPVAQQGPDWMTSFEGVSASPFPTEMANKLLAPLSNDDIELKPDGLLYLPEIKYRRRLNAAFGPGGWGMVPRGETHISHSIVSREWALICLGRLVAVARGEQEFFDPGGVPTASEACKSNALMRCCKDLGIASELW